MVVSEAAYSVLQLPLATRQGTFWIDFFWKKQALGSFVFKFKPSNLPICGHLLFANCNVLHELISTADSMIEREVWSNHLSCWNVFFASTYLCGSEGGNKKCDLTLLSKCPNHEKDCANFFGLLRKAEL